MSSLWTGDVEIMGRKKIRVSNELIQRIEGEGVAGLNRNECRALWRKGYLERKRISGADGSVRYAYKLASNIL